MVTKKKLREENAQLTEENTTLKTLLRAYMKSNEKLQDEVTMLNASLDCTAAELERWKEIAHKADEMRRKEHGSMVR